MDTRRSFIDQALKVVGGAIAAILGIKAKDAVAATCGWYVTGNYRCRTAYCAPVGSRIHEQHQAYYCNGVPTGSYRWVKIGCC